MIEFLKSALIWFSGLSKTTMAVVSIFTIVVSGMVNYIYYIQKQIPDNENYLEIQQKLDEMQKQMTATHLVNQSNWINQNKYNDSISGIMVDIKTDVRDLTMITAANSNSALLHELMPYLQGIKSDTYKLVLEIQKNEIRNKVKLDSMNIQVRKIKLPRQ